MKNNFLKITKTTILIHFQLKVFSKASITIFLNNL
jgi:hypothetical protein